MNNAIRPADEAFRSESIAFLKESYRFLTVESIGQSRCKREITAISLGNIQNRTLILGGVHGSEWITCNLIIMFLQKLCKAITKRHKAAPGMNSYAWYLRRGGVTFVPCLNPDGVEIAIHGTKCAGAYEQLVKKLSAKGIWQANAAGVDLNHNFPADWEKLRRLEIKNGITGPNNTRFGGEKPSSEPETRAIIDYCGKSQFKRALAFHSQGEEIYWNYGDIVPDGSLQLAQAFSKSSGYTLSEPEGLAVGGGFKDWFILEYNRPAFTIEVGKGKNPLPIEDLMPIYEKLNEMLSLSIVL